VESLKIVAKLSVGSTFNKVAGGFPSQYARILKRLSMLYILNLKTLDGAIVGQGDHESLESAQ
jgi:hypothetical protein